VLQFSTHLCTDVKGYQCIKNGWFLLKRFSLCVSHFSIDFQILDEMIVVYTSWICDQKNLLPALIFRFLSSSMDLGKFYPV